jgi:glycosyltransferase involved in cell wall biosynthesis
VIGGGPLLAELRARFPRVRFTGELSRSQSLEWIAAANVLVSASVLEGAPTVVREARALGVPVVACPAGDLRLWAESDPGLWLT